MNSSGQWINKTLFNTYAIKEDQPTPTSDYTAVFPESIPLQENSFVKILTKNESEYGLPNYYYTGEPGSGKYDNFVVYGDKLVVSSDAPVFVHILSSAQPYSECKDWSVVEWENNRKEEELLYYGDFSSTNYSAIFHDIPLDQIESGRSYVAIAHFANNKTVMSEVRQK